MSKRWAWPLLGAALLGVTLLTGWACSPPPTDVFPPVAPKSAEPPDAELQGPDLFAEVAAVAGIAFAYRNGEDIKPPHLSILESLGGGVALLDYDGDGLLDVYIPGGGYFAGPAM